MIGHPQGACGAAGLAATVLCMNRGLVHPTINLDEPDPQCNLNHIVDAGHELPVKTALCNCIAFGSKNSALIVSQAC
jgi:3-oxoacyl-[acyl-carrier-protein] synthase II